MQSFYGKEKELNYTVFVSVLQNILFTKTTILIQDMAVNIRHHIHL